MPACHQATATRHAGGAGEALPRNYRPLLPRDAIRPVYQPTYVAANESPWDGEALVIGGGDHLKLLGRIYIGYSVSPLGVALGTVYGFIDGFIGGWLIGWLYNRFAAK